MSRWGKSEIEWIALAYVRALANDGDEWKRISRDRTYSLLTNEQKRDSCGMLGDYYNTWFEMVAGQITDASGALGVGGFWNARRIEQARTHDSAAITLGRTLARLDRHTASLPRRKQTVKPACN